MTLALSVWCAPLYVCVCVCVCVRVCVCVWLLPASELPFPRITFPIVLTPSPRRIGRNRFLVISILCSILVQVLPCLHSLVREYLSSTHHSCSCGLLDWTLRSQWISFPFLCLLETSGFPTTSYRVRRKLKVRPYCTEVKGFDHQSQRISTLCSASGKHRHRRQTKPHKRRRRNHCETDTSPAMMV